MDIISRETAKDLKWAADVIQGHITGNKFAQTMLGVKTYKDSLFRLRDRLERLASLIEECESKTLKVMQALAALHKAYYGGSVFCQDELDALIEAYDKWLD